MTYLIWLIANFPGMLVLGLAVAAVFASYGVTKFKDYEQQAVAEFVSTHPVLRFGPKVLGVTGFAVLSGVMELLCAALIVAGIFWAPLGVAGGILGAGILAATLSILPFIQTFQPGVGSPFLSDDGLFLIKDLGLIGGCLAIAQHHAAQLI